MANSPAVPGPAGRPDAATLWSLYVDEGLTIAALAKQWGVAAQTVGNWLVAAGVPRGASAATPRNDIRDDQIVRLYTEAGCTAAQIAERLGCSTSLVYFRLARHGVARRPGHAGSASAPPTPSSPTSTTTVG
jgi:transposase-like protein